MKNFTKQNFKTNPLWIRLLIMTFMLLLGSSSAWATYYAVGPAVGGWSTWVELKTTDNNKYTCLASPGEFKITNQNGDWGLDKNWDHVVGGTGVTKYNNNGNNASLQSGYNQICFYPTGNNNNGWLEGETVTANAGFFELNAWNIKYNGAWIDGGINANSSHDLGELTSAPEITGLLVNVWKNSSGDVCGVSAKYKVNDGSLKDLDFSDNNWDSEQSGSNTNQTIKDESISLDLPSTPGQYTVTITFTANINNNGQGNCQESTEMTAVITYNIKGYSLGGYIQVGDAMADKSTYYSTYDLAKQTDGTYKGTFSFSKSHNNAQYIYIVDHAGTIYGHQTKDYPMSPGNTTTLSSSNDNKVKATIALNTEYVFTFNPTTGAFTYSLACTDPKAEDFSYADLEPTYDGTAKSATVKWQDDNTSTGITVKYDGYTTAPTNAGTYAITVSTAAHGNICASKDDISLGDFTITCSKDLNKDKFNCTLPTGAVYNGKAQSATVSWKTGDASTNGAITVYYKKEVDEYTNVAPTLAGTYTVAVKVTTAGNYCVSESFIEFDEKFTISTKAQNPAISISTDAAICGTEANLGISGGEGNGVVTYEFVGEHDGATITNESLTVTKSCTVTVKATKAGEEGKYSPATATKEITFTIPTAPTFTTNLAQVCSGVAFNLNEKFPRNSGEAGTLTWYKASDDSQVSDPTSVTITELTSYYAKATNNNCTSDKSLNCTVNVDAQPTLKLASSPTVCPNMQINLNSYVDPSTLGTVTWYSDTDRNNVITDGLVTPTEKTTYYASSTNGVCDPEKGELVVNVYGIPDEMPAYTSTPATSCKETPNSDGSIALRNPLGYITYTLDGEEGESNVWTGLSVGTHKLAATVNTCPSLTKEWDVEVGVEDITPDATVSITGDASFCEGGNTVLTCNVTDKKGNVTDYQWYNGEELIQGAAASTYTANAAGNYKVVVTVLNSTCQDEFWSDEKVVTINPKPSEPVLSIPSPICAGSNFTLPEEDNNQRTITWNVNNRELTNLTAGTHNYTAKIIDVYGCESNEVTYTITVTALPEITSISQDVQEPVFYEDVTLTATATAGATVKWYEGDVEAEGLTYVVTSASDASKTVTAKAFLNGCESAVASHTVAFSAEDCTPEVSNDIQIKFYHPSAKSTDDAKKGQWWGMGTLYYSTNNSTWKSIDMGNSTSGSVTKTITNVTTNKLYVYFESYWTYSHNTKAKTNTLTLDRGNKYDIKITRHGDNNTSATATATKTGSPTQDPPIKAPAVKMVSAEYDEVNDKIVATGAVYKTGCGETFWGFQYSADGQTWGTTDADFIRPSSGNSLSEPGVFAHSFEIPNANGGDIYYIRAYAINNYNKDNYSLNSAVFSETKIPVEIPSSTIESATISLVDSDGKESTDTEVCPQSTVYLRVDYTGGDYKEFEAAEDFPGTNLVEVTRNKLDNYAIFSFTATSAGTANITISNNNSSVTPATGVAITLNDVETITTPVISMDPASGMICSDGEATITIYEPNANYTYALYKDSELADDESKGSYTVNEAGSYTVVATESVCGTSASSMAIELKVVSSDVKINLVADPTTTSPWQPIKLTVTPPAGYDYTLEGINDVEYTQNGDVYTVKIPRPETWQAGNSGTTLKTANKIFTAKIKVSDTTSCGSKSVTVKLTDTEENCQ